MTDTAASGQLRDKVIGDVVLFHPKTEIPIPNSLEMRPKTRTYSYGPRASARRKIPPKILLILHKNTRDSMYC